MMPVYDFKCPKCGNTRRQTTSIKDIDDFVAVCVCGERMVRVYGLGIINFKGSGFYSTDKKK